MRRVLSTTAFVCIAVVNFICYAVIPDGNWMRKVFYEEYNMYGADEYLKISLGHSERMDGREFFGSLKNVDGKSVIWKFADPEASGNTVKCKAYLYLAYLSDDSDMVSGDQIKDCTISYDEIQKTISVEVGDEDVSVFKESDRCTFVVCDGNKVNVRKAPVNGEKIGMLTKGQSVRMISMTYGQKNDDVWYEIKLPDSRTGYVSGKYVEPFSSGWLDIPEGVLKSEITYGHIFTDSNPEDESCATLNFCRKGKMVMCHSFIGFPNTFRLPIEEYLMGRIEENKIILDSYINVFATDADVYDIFDSGNFAEFKKFAESQNPVTYYYYEGNIYDAEGIEYSREYE